MKIRSPALVAFVLALFRAAASSLPAQTTIVFSNGENNTTPQATTTANPLTLTIASGAATQSGAISGNGSVTQTGGGALTLSGANTYTGGTVISGGTLVISADGQLGASSGSL